MAFEINIQEKLKFLEISYIGEVKPEELFDALHKIVEIGTKENISKVLADCSDMNGGHSITDLYSLISSFDGNNIYRLKEALIMPKLEASEKEVKFYETACFNRGINVKLFKDRMDAVSWLTS